MIKFFVDGSNKGIAIGAGVVEVDKFGFMTTYEGHRLHPLADSYLAELFALDLALDVSLEKGYKNIMVLVDTFRVENSFSHKNEKGIITFTNYVHKDHHEFALSIREKIKTFYAKNGNDSSISIQKLLQEKFEYTVYTNTAHTLSRCYFKHYDELYYSDDTPLRKEGNGAKIAINHATKPDTQINSQIDLKSDGVIDVTITKDAERWYSHVGTDADKVYVPSRHLVNIFVHTYNNLCKDFSNENLIVRFHSTEDLVEKVLKSVNYVNCPEDIKTKGKWALQMVEEGKFIIAD